MSIECQVCGWIGKEEECITPFSEDEGGCPVCLSTDFLDVEDEPHPNINENGRKER